MRIQTFRDKEAARKALTTEGISLVEINIGESYSHKDTVVSKGYGQAILGFTDGDEHTFEKLYVELIDKLAADNNLPEGADHNALRNLQPVDDPFAVMDSILDGPFAPGTGTDTDPRMTINPDTLKLWTVIYARDCHDDCPYQWFHHFNVAIYETTKAKTVHMLLTSEQVTE